jgi:hypothetical protein
MSSRAHTMGESKLTLTRICHKFASWTEGMSKR